MSLGAVSSLGPASEVWPAGAKQRGCMVPAQGGWCGRREAASASAGPRSFPGLCGLCRDKPPVLFSVPLWPPPPAVLAGFCGRGARSSCARPPYASSSRGGKGVARAGERVPRPQELAQGDCACRRLRRASARVTTCGSADAQVRGSALVDSLPLLSVLWVYVDGVFSSGPRAFVCCPGFSPRCPRLEGVGEAVGRRARPGGDVDAGSSGMGMSREGSLRAAAAPACSVLQPWRLDCFLLCAVVALRARAALSPLPTHAAALSARTCGS